MAFFALQTFKGKFYYCSRYGTVRLVITYFYEAYQQTKFLSMAVFESSAKFDSGRTKFVYGYTKLKASDFVRSLKV